MHNSRGGFSLLELLIVIALMVILSVIALANLGPARSIDDLNDTTKEMAALLRQAQSQAMSQAQDASWGVHFANATNTTPFYALFYGSSYASGTTQGYYTLSSTVAYNTSTLGVGSSTDVIFSPIIGTASVSTSIQLYLANLPAESSTISIASSGEVTD